MAARKTINAPDMKRRLYASAVSPYASLPPLPVVVDYHGRNRRADVMRTGDHFHVTDRLEVVVKDPKKKLNLSELLDIFENIHAADELLPFLEMCGPFREEKQTQDLSWSEFCEWQAFVRDLRLSVASPRPPKHSVGAIDLFRISEPEMFIRIEKNEHGRVVVWIEFHAKTALEALGTAVYVEKMRSADVAACALKGCKRIFERTSDHERLCCSPAHTRQRLKAIERSKAKGASNGKA